MSHTEPLVRENRVKRAIAEGRRAVGLRLTIPSPEIVDMLGGVKPDFIFIDYEHGVFDLPSVENICRAADLIGATPIARVPDISAGTIVHLLDRGVQGIIGPHIASRADAETLVRNCLYAPQGRRSFGGGRGARYQDGIADMPAYMAACNAQMLIGAMFESRDAIDALDEILAVPGIDYFMFGPADFAQDMGHPGTPKHPEVVAAMEAAIARVHAAGRLMREDIMRMANIKDIVMSGMRAFAQAG